MQSWPSLIFRKSFHAIWVHSGAGANRDPLSGHPVDDVYRPLFRKIVRTAPAPVGLG